MASVNAGSQSGLREAIDLPHPPAEEMPEKNKKERSTKPPARKGAGKNPAARKTIGEVSDDSEAEGDEGNAGSRWTDAEVQQLIQSRALMDDEFKKNAKKQGVHAWDKLHVRMIVCCEGFNKSEEAVRKKWKTVYKQYTTDKRLLSISGDGRKATCRFSEDIDIGFHNRANVKKVCHGDARGPPNPIPLDLNDPSPVHGSVEGGSTSASAAGIEPQVDQGSDRTNSTPQSVKSHKKSPCDTYSSFMFDIVKSTDSIAEDLHETVAILQRMEGHIGKLVEKF